MKVRPTVVVFPLVVIAVLAWNRATIKNFITGQTLSSPNSSPDKSADSVPSREPTPLNSTWQVVSTSDGDTIEVRQGIREERIRLCGIDAPEKAQTLGPESRMHLQQLINQAGSEVQLSIIESDRYGRQVAEVSIVLENGEEKLLQEEQLKAGLAMVYDQYLLRCPNSKAFLEAEDIAKQNSVGVWSDPGTVPPWEYRSAQRQEGNDDTTTNSSEEELTPQPSPSDLDTSSMYTQPQPLPSNSAEPSPTLDPFTQTTSSLFESKEVQRLRETKVCPGCDLKGANLADTDLTGVDISGADLSSANLTNATLNNANLSHAIFNGTSLIGAKFKDSNLSKANLSRANLNKAQLTNVNLTHANLKEAILTTAVFETCNLSDADLRNAKFNDGSSLSDTLIINSDLQRANLSETNLVGVNLSNSRVGGAVFNNSNLRSANLTGVPMQLADLKEATMPDGTIHE